ncbi:DNA gyrase C-terminal beta-propeller domain-containing protein, partial [Thioalkalivibrio sp. ALE23]|uniref:DNA gyrase C-terminal beta-propeller domain-containing protein n=1 Tax=Thioalkalivibrio sp. ALE23 TaxID=1265495 RepID=UPI00035CBF97
LEVSVSYNVMALDGQRPMQLGIRDVFEHFRAHRIEVIQRRTQYDLDRALERLHILEGYLAALDRLDETIATIRGSKDTEEARGALEQLLSIDATQAQAILDLKLQRLTGMQIQDIRDEHGDLTAKVEDLRDILARPERQTSIMRDELLNLSDQHATARGSEIDNSLSKVSAADLIPEEQVMLIGTRNGYLKRLPADAMSRQNRGTKGRSIIALDDDDVVTTFHSGNSHDYLLALTDQGQVHAVKAYDVPDTGLGNRGRHYRNIYEGLEGDVVAMLTVPDLDSEQASLVIFTAGGYVKRTALSAFSGAKRRGGVQGIRLNDDDLIVCARISSDPESEEIVMTASGSRAIRYPLDEARAIGRTSQGVRGIRLKDGESVLSAEIVHQDSLDTSHLMVVTRKGVGKATPLTDFRLQSRGGQGVTAHAPNKKSGEMVAAAVIGPGVDVVLFTDEGGANRVAGSAVPKNGRATAGSSIIRQGSVTNLLAVPATEDGSLPSNED